MSVHALPESEKAERSALGRTDPTGVLGSASLARPWAFLKSGFVVAGVLVMVVVPEIWAQYLGTANPTILPGNYLGRLAVIAGLTLAPTLAVAVQARHLDQTR